MNYLRVLIGAGLAAVVTIALFYLMPLLIEMADKSLDDKPATKIADITMSLSKTPPFLAAINRRFAGGGRIPSAPGPSPRP